MAYAILRAAKLKSMGNIGGSIAHTFRSRDTPNADPERTPQNEHIGPATPEAVKAGIAARLPEKRRSDAVLCIEYFIGASPEAFKDVTLAAKMGNTGGKYFDDALAWLRQRHGAENVISAHIHRDETTPHMVVYVVPRDGEKLNAKKWLGGKEALSKMQTDFAEKVGKKFGLQRGIEGSKATHKTIKEFYGELGQAAQAEVPAITPEDLTPRRMEAQDWSERLGLFRREEDPGMVAARVTSKVGQAVRPALTKLREVQARERQQAGAVARLSKALSELREKFAPFLELTADQFAQLAATARRMVDENRKLAQAQAQAQAQTQAQTQSRGITFSKPRGPRR
ncbi:recombinase [Azospirillum palustre]|uniref:Recombinase n=1 Tax=Azospirillum palustre TaxID=2044885 RepID=A0A2B8BP24_9PROT|nr:MobV family relaxase [Azospirillum palustre]PGH59479.1 recombinase [Azospirillum palustre]